jgi:hypothetical protein
VSLLFSRKTLLQGIGLPDALEVTPVVFHHQSKKFPVRESTAFEGITNVESILKENSQQH